MLDPPRSHRPMTHSCCCCSACPPHRPAWTSMLTGKRQCSSHPVCAQPAPRCCVWRLRSFWTLNRHPLPMGFFGLAWKCSGCCQPVQLAQPAGRTAIPHPDITNARRRGQRWRCNAPRGAYAMHNDVLLHCSCDPPAQTMPPPLRPGLRGPTHTHVRRLLQIALFALQTSHVWRLSVSAHSSPTGRHAASKTENKQRERHNHNQSRHGR